MWAVSRAVWKECPLAAKMVALWVADWENQKAAELVHSRADSTVLMTVASKAGLTAGRWDSQWVVN